MILNYITIGGPIEIYTIMRGKVEDIITKYHSMIGYSQMPPYYALGFFQGSNTYKSLTNVQKTFQGYSDMGVALEGLFVTDYNQQPH
jgi:alpha-glucosidase (family GH31 glycosyl hydrolase)